MRGRFSYSLPKEPKLFIKQKHEGVSKCKYHFENLTVWNNSLKMLRKEREMMQELLLSMPEQMIDGVTKRLYEPQTKESKAMKVRLSSTDILEIGHLSTWKTEEPRKWCPLPGYSLQPLWKMTVNRPSTYIDTMWNTLLIKCLNNFASGNRAE